MAAPGDLRLTDLPNEILLNIFSYLSYNERIDVGHACRRFSQLMCSRLLWKDITIDVDFIGCDQEARQQYAKHMSMVLGQQCYRELSTEKESGAEDNQDHLEEDTVEVKNSVTDVREIGRVLPSCSVTGQIFYPNLKRITLRVPDMPMRDFLVRFSNLRHLNLVLRSNISEHSETMLTAETFKVLKDLKELQTLIFFRSPDYSDCDCVNEAVRNYFLSSPKLTHIELGFKVDVDIVKAIVDHCSQLQYLKFDYSDTSEAFMATLKKPSFLLSTLMLPEGPRLDDKCLKAIALSFPNLQSLKVVLSPETSDEGMNFLFRACSRLTSLAMRIFIADDCDNLYRDDEDDEYDDEDDIVHDDNGDEGDRNRANLDEDDRNRNNDEDRKKDNLDEDDRNRNSDDEDDRNRDSDDEDDRNSDNGKDDRNRDNDEEHDRDNCVSDDRNRENCKDKKRDYQDDDGRNMDNGVGDDRNRDNCKDRKRDYDDDDRNRDNGVGDRNRDDGDEDRNRDNDGNNRNGNIDEDDRNRNNGDEYDRNRDNDGNNRNRDNDDDKNRDNGDDRNRDNSDEDNRNSDNGDEDNRNSGNGDEGDRNSDNGDEDNRNSDNGDEDDRNRDNGGDDDGDNGGGDRNRDNDENNRNKDNDDDDRNRDNGDDRNRDNYGNNRNKDNDEDDRNRDNRDDDRNRDNYGNNRNKDNDEDDRKRVNGDDDRNMDSGDEDDRNRDNDGNNRNKDNDEDDRNMDSGDDDRNRDNGGNNRNNDDEDRNSDNDESNKNRDNGDEDDGNKDNDGNNRNRDNDEDDRNRDDNEDDRNRKNGDEADRNRNNDEDYKNRENDEVNRNGVNQDAHVANIFYGHCLHGLASTETKGKLQKLFLNNFLLLGEQVFTHLCKNQQNLRGVSLENCGVGDSNIVFMAKNCRRLRNVHIWNCPQAGPMAVAALLHELPKLHKLTWHHNGTFRFEDLLPLPTTTRPNRENGLEILELGPCTNVTGRGLSALLSLCPNLLHLQIIADLSLDDDCIMWILRSCALLQKLKIRRLHEDRGEQETLSDASLRYIQTMGLKLQQVLLPYSSLFSDRVLAETVLQFDKLVFFLIKTDGNSPKEIHGLEESLELEVSSLKGPKKGVRCWWFIKLQWLVIRVQRLRWCASDHRLRVLCIN